MFTKVNVVATKNIRAMCFTPTCCCLPKHSIWTDIIEGAKEQNLYRIEGGERGMQSGFFCNRDTYEILPLIFHQLYVITHFPGFHHYLLYLSYDILCNCNNHTVRTYEYTIFKAWKCISVRVRSLDTNVNKWCMQFISRWWQPVLLTLSHTDSFIYYLNNVPHPPKHILKVALSFNKLNTRTV